MQMEEITALKDPLLVINCILLAIGACGGPLMVRLYFLHGGKSVLLGSSLQTCGFPIILIPLIASYIQRRKREGSNAKLFFIKPFLFIDCAIIGILLGLDNTFYSYGCSKLPVSTSSLIIATQIGFGAGFAFLLVNQKFTKYSIIGIVLLTIGAAVPGMGTSDDMPERETKMEYVVGLLMTLVSAALFGLILPLVELIYSKARQTVTYTLVMEIQMVIFLFATAFCIAGMFINNDFQAIPGEARGEIGYYIILVSTAIIYQCCFLGATGVIFCASSLLSGIIIGALLPVTEILAVIFYRENFQVKKGVAVALSLSGLISYFFGEIKHKEQQQISEIRYPLLT